ncbi:MAG: valine--tRNA ligase, partial [Treponema sp.]|nr:valine--tRNA ligase [Treponema sp.]
KEEFDDPQAEKDFGFLQELVRMIRTLRSECTVNPDKKIRALVRIAGGGRAAFLKENAELVKLLAGLSGLEIAAAQAGSAAEPAEAKPTGSIGLAGAGFEAFVYIADAVEIGALRQKFAKEIEKDRKFIAVLQSKLANENFLKNAPQELVNGEKQKLKEVLERNGKLESWLRDMA